MSVKIMGMVWDLEIDSTHKLVLLAYADHASHDGTNIYPSVSTIAKKCCLSERTIQRITRQLEQDGYLVSDSDQSGGRNKTNQWHIPLKGDKLTPFKKIKGVNHDTKKPERVTSATLKGDIAMSPESSLTVNLNNHENIFSEKDKNYIDGLPPEEYFDRAIEKQQEELSEKFGNSFGKTTRHTADSIREGAHRSTKSFQENSNGKDNKIENFIQGIPVHLQDIARAYYNRSNNLPISDQEKKLHIKSFDEQYLKGITVDSIQMAYSYMIDRNIAIVSPKSLTGIAGSFERGELKLEKPNHKNKQEAFPLDGMVSASEYLAARGR